MNVSPDALKRWPVVGGVLTLILLAALSLAYWDNYQDRQRYLQSRNFRLLAVLAGQTENLIETRARIVREALGNARTIGKSDAAAWVADTVKGLKNTKDLKDVALTDTAVEGTAATPSEVAGSVVPLWRQRRRRRKRAAGSA